LTNADLRTPRLSGVQPEGIDAFVFEPPGNGKLANLIVILQPQELDSPKISGSPRRVSSRLA
jgi:hypothetical protein